MVAAVLTATFYCFTYSDIGKTARSAMQDKGTEAVEEEVRKQLSNARALA